MAAIHSLLKSGLHFRIPVSFILLAILLLDYGGIQAQTAPSVSSVAITSNAGSNNTYGKDDVIQITVTFSEAVTVTGTPQIQIDMDPADWGAKWANYSSGSGSTALVFSHTVVEPNLSTKGIAVLANTLRLTNGSIKSTSSSTSASLTHTGLSHNSAHMVDWRMAQPAIDCTTTLTVTRGGLKEVHGTWTVANDNAACYAGGWFVDYRDSVNVTWGTNRVTNVNSNKEFRYGGLTPGQTYEFRIRLIDGRGKGKRDSEIQDAWTTASNVVSRELGGGIPWSTIHKHGPGALWIKWGSVTDVGTAVDSVEHYKIRHREKGSDTWTMGDDLDANTNWADDTDIYYTRPPFEHDVKYEVQVGAQVTIGAETKYVWASAHEYTGINVPLRIWFIDDTPNHNRLIGRVFMMVDGNYSNMSALCDINGGTINCPPRTLVSLDVVPQGRYHIVARADVEDQVGTTGEYINFPVRGGGSVRYMGISAGVDNIIVNWDVARDFQVGMQYLKDGRAYRVKEFDSHIVQYRQGFSGEWTDVRKSTTATSHEISGVPPGTYQVQVIPCVAVVEITGYSTSGDGQEAAPHGGTETGELRRCLQKKERDVEVTLNRFASETRKEYYYEDDPGIVRGMHSIPKTVTVGPENTGIPTEVAEWWAGGGEDIGSLQVHWYLAPNDGGSIIAGYDIRYRKQGTSDWSYTQAHPLHDVYCIYVAFTCTAPARHWIFGLQSGSQYELGIRAYNANGHGEWVAMGTYQAS